MQVTFMFAINQRVKSTHHGIEGVINSLSVGQSMKNGYWVEYLNKDGTVISKHFLESELAAIPQSKSKKAS